MTDLSNIEKLLQERLELQEQRLEKISTSLGREYSRDFAEQAMEREDDEVKVELEKEAIDEIALIRAALARLESGEYGSCTSCGGDISEGRLEALPYTHTCIKCETEAEGNRP